MRRSAWPAAAAVVVVLAFRLARAAWRLVRAQQRVHRAHVDLLRVLGQARPWGGPAPVVWLERPDPAAYSLAGWRRSGDGRVWTRYRGRMRRAAVVWLVAGMLLALAACSGAGNDAETTGWTRLSPSQLDQKLATEDVFLVNVHVPYEGEIPDTDAFIPYTQVASQADELPGDASSLVLYCRSGNMSTDAAEELVAAGVTGFFELDGGFNAWQAAGLPFEVDPAGE